jgi:hypothetical protein
MIMCVESGVGRKSDMGQPEEFGILEITMDHVRMCKRQILYGFSHDCEDVRQCARGARWTRY